MGILRNVKNVRVGFVDPEAIGLEVHEFAVALDHLTERVVDLLAEIAQRELLPQIETGKDESSPGMLLLGNSVEIRGVADLGLHLLLAVTEVVVRDESHDNTLLVPCRQ